MTFIAWIFLAAWLGTDLLLAVALHGNTDLAGENRALRQELADALRHPSGRGGAA